MDDRPVIVARVGSAGGAGAVGIVASAGTRLGTLAESDAGANARC